MIDHVLAGKRDASTIGDLDILEDETIEDFKD